MSKTHKTADAKSIEIVTKPIPVSIGIEPTGDKSLTATRFIEESAIGFAPMGVEPIAEFWGNPRPDLNGLRVKLPNSAGIYLIDRGYRRWIPNPATYNNLFRNWEGIVEDIDIDEIPLGIKITSGAILARTYGTAPVYLIDQGVKRWILSPGAMDKYYFSWERVYILPAASINAIPNGPSISE